MFLSYLQGEQAARIGYGPGDLLELTISPFKIEGSGCQRGGGFKVFAGNESTVKMQFQVDSCEDCA